MASSSSVNASSENLCSICLEIVSSDNSRGKVELICGHIFHLDCIGSEFNYRSKMRCPTCRVVENGEWLIPTPESEQEETESDERDITIHICIHDARVRASTPRGQLVIAPVVHYHQHTTVISQPPVSNIVPPFMYGVQRAPGYTPAYAPGYGPGYASAYTPTYAPGYGPGYASGYAAQNSHTNVEARHVPARANPTWPRDINEPTNMTLNEPTERSDVGDSTTELNLVAGLGEDRQQGTQDEA